MTIHCVISYFENGSCGYVLGTDSAAAVEDDGIEYDVDQMEKAFFGKNHIGIIRGAIDVDLGCSVRPEQFNSALNAALRSLDNVFDDIKSGASYSHIPILAKSEYAILLAERNQHSLELFAVSNELVNGNSHKADKLHELTKDDKAAESLVWYAPCTRDYAVHSLPINNLQNAENLAVLMITDHKVVAHINENRDAAAIKSNMFYKVTPPHLYSLLGLIPRSLLRLY